MVIHFYCKIYSYSIRETSHSDLSIACGAQLGEEVARKLLDEKSLLFYLGMLIVIQMPQNGVVGISGLKNLLCTQNCHSPYY
jgi:hypothetical protein